MKQLVTISGKGGTGKTILSASFATLAHNKIMVDCDADALLLYVKPAGPACHTGEISCFYRELEN